MIKIGDIEIENGLFLAPMEDVTNIAFRKLCKEFGADIVYTEFVNSDGLVRNNKKTYKKMLFEAEERPIGIQIYGGNLEPMIGAAKMAEELEPDLIDINAGCWVKKVAHRGAGAGLLKDPEYMQKMAAEIVKTVDLPVTVKTRLGWDSQSINILEVAKRLEDAGVKALTLHCRTRVEGHNGDAHWEWIEKVKETVEMPVILNGGIMTAEDAIKAFESTPADGIMIARGAIQHPWIFREILEIQKYGKIITEITPRERIMTALKHLKLECAVREERGAVIPFRKYYSGYLKGLHGASKIRRELMKYIEYAPIEDILLNYLNDLESYISQKETAESEE